MIDWLYTWNDYLKKKMSRVLVVTRCRVCNYMIHISEVEEGCKGFFIDFDPTCRICGNAKTFKIDSIKVKMTCRNLEQ